MPLGRASAFTSRWKVGCSPAPSSKVASLPRPWRSPVTFPPDQARPLPGLPFPSRLDLPLAVHPAPSHSVLVRGWLAVRTRARLEQPVIVAGETRIPTKPEVRPDVRVGHRNRQVLGFRRFVELTPALVGVAWELEVRVDGTVFRAPLDIEPSESALGEFERTKRDKLDRIESLLRCPRIDGTGPASVACGGRLSREGESLRCERCGKQYGATSSHFDFLDEDLRELAQVEHTDNVSSWGYDPFADRVIASCAEGLVLDAGSGLKGTTYGNVVNLEIVDYPTTDVLGVAESLPFADGSFDGALSLAVLEHVRDPFRAAAELARVVRPGGTMYVAVPFLQPYHGYPHHYYNMTLTGLENLFTQWFRIDESGSPPYGWPVWTLTWFLNSYVDGLPPETAQRFKEMKVGELMQPGDRYLADDFVQDLSPDATFELASVNYLVGTRR
jgi:SAM-dependent methyltransferase